MSEVLPQFRLVRPATAEAAIAAKQASPSARICAGGTDLMVAMRRGLVDTDTLIDLAAIKEMARIESNGEGLHIGAGVTLREIDRSSVIAADFLAVAQASRAVAGPTHREVATLGGNLCLDTRCLYYNQSHSWRKASDFCLKYKGDICHVAPAGKRCRAAYSGDLAPALMVHRAELEIAGPDGRRRIALDDFYREDGADHLLLGATEIVTGVHLAPSTATSAYAKVRIRGAIDFPLAGVAVACEKLAPSTHRFSIAVTGTNSRPVLVDGLEPLTVDEEPEAYFASLNKLVQKSVSPQRTTTTAAHYRRLSVAALASRLARNLLAA
jgi:4-hydroxybenzoyl-CoA reductase subunit beta